MRSISIPLLTLLLVLVNCRRGDRYHGDSVRLTDIDTLTFYNNRYTTGYRSKPIRQMKCISGYSNCRHAPSNMQCYNRGTDGRDVQVDCENGNVKLKWKKDILWDELKCHVKGIRILTILTFLQVLVE
ncbi:hypothetical protein JH06_0318 [Blastocystis sp. subtype 4]|uniref:hypothetical protein n=1 Tax=Blastocystis sp. subtype 4 TaxID=944170 RepID=UPI000711D60F|nr:hypothetical protein JH06_0318 [Blastocystis sp. subtype 4]KNB46191.1 hypothetical protein JH06_0318 [Blastocystis sp. subtype 4]|eukprot:XP_014529634.1 hypothetical protein JH06_0318 [Blastocystis sp. subtype 4]